MRSTSAELSRASRFKFRLWFRTRFDERCLRGQTARPPGPAIALMMSVAAYNSNEQLCGERRG